MCFLLRWYFCASFISGSHTIKKINTIFELATNPKYVHRCYIVLGNKEVEFIEFIIKGKDPTIKLKIAM